MANARSSSEVNNLPNKDFEKLRVTLLESVKTQLFQIGNQHHLDSAVILELSNQALSVLKRTLLATPTRKDQITTNRILTHWEKVVSQLLASIELMLNRVERDYGLLSKLFLPDIIDPVLTNIVFTDSDPHKRGKTVFILEFQAKESLERPNQKAHKIVYKPSDLQVDAMIVGNLSILSQVDLGYQGQQSLAEIFN